MVERDKGWGGGRGGTSTKPCVWVRRWSIKTFMFNIFVLLFADTTPLMVGFRTQLSASQAKTNLSDTNTTIILPSYYFGKYGFLRALKSNTTRAGYIKFQVGFANF